MSVGSVVQVGGAVRHRPLLSLTPFAHTGMDEDDPQDKSSSSSSRDAHKSTIGGFIGDGQLAWRALGPTIEVLDPLTCSRQAAWTFGAILRNTSPRVTCVCGIGVGAITHIVIGVDLGCENPEGMVGVLSLRRSRIIRAFHFRHKVTNVAMVTGGEKVVDPSTMASELRQSQGLVAVATSHALLFLVDLALDLGDDITSDEMSPAPMVDICLQEYQSELKRAEIIGSQHHPVLKLTENYNNGKLFRLLGPDDNILHEAPSHEVAMTALLYVPQIASLVVGYSFGSFQIINLNLITIDCASPYEENLPPVLSFAYQEPENDPRSFVYLWVCRSPSSGENTPRVGKSSCSLYAMSYDKKEWIESHGLWYQGLVSMSPRFDFETLGGIGESLCPALPSRILSAMTVVGTTPSANVASPLSGVLMDDALSSSGDENEPVPELSLCLFCWEAHVLDRGGVVTKHYIAIFDINQWYQSQMPSRLRLSGQELCPYLSFHTLDKVPTSVGERILGGSPWKGSWSRHCTRAPCEKVWFPSSLSYEFNLLTSEGLATYRCPSVQQSALSALLRQGPAALVSPAHAFRACVFAGVVAAPPDEAASCSAATVCEREQLLNTALEYHLLPLLIQCVVEFGEGKFSHLGCSPELLLGWAWNQLRLIKTSSDSLCAPLFAAPSEVDDGEPLTSQSLSSLHQNLTYLSHIKTIVTTIRDHAGEVTRSSAGVLEGKVQVASLVHQHLQVLLWFYHCGLLPQCPPEEVVDEEVVPFPAVALDNIYRKRREEVRAMNPSLAGTELLLVDSLTEEGGGGLLAEVWEKGEGGVYPPPSLHALLSMYLLPGMATHTKHRIVQYLFLDLASLLSENYSNVLEELVKFPSSFSLSPSLIKLTQAFWLIDNKDFQAGLSVLLDPLVNPNDITLDQHRRIIRAFLYQGEESNALAYSHLRQPPKVELEDVRMTLSLLLANGRIREAFHYQRQQRVSANAKQLLGHMFKGCEELGRLESVVHLPLSPMEEDCFVEYLGASKVPFARDVLLVYYLQQARYKEISSLCEGAGRSHATPLARQRRRLDARTALVEGYINHLPDVRAQMVGPSKSRPARVMYSKPQPLSARVRQSAGVLHTPRSKASSFRSAASPEGFKASVTPYTPFRSKAQRRKAIRSWRQEVGLVKMDAHQEKAESLDESRIVFPKVTEEAARPFSLPTSPPLFNAASRMESPVRGGGGSLLQEEVSRIMEDLLRKSMNIRSPGRERGISEESRTRLNLSADVVSLLKTPPIGRLTPSRRTPALQDSLSETPQSILKVRKILQQSLTESESESPFSSFPLHRGGPASARATRDKSFETVGSVSEGGLTPKQLRFDLSISRRLSMDQVVEEEPREEEETPAPPPLPSSAPPAKRPSLQRKRKRSPSPPEQSKSFSGEVPTPRKPLPRFNSQSPEDKVLRPTCDEDAGPTNPVATNYPPRSSLTPAAASSDPPSPTKYRSISEVKHSSKATTREVCRTYSERLVRTVSTQWSPHVSRSYLKGDSPPGGEELHSADNSMQEDSFHSVESYESKEWGEGSEDEVKEAGEEILKEEDEEILKEEDEEILKEEDGEIPKEEDGEIPKEEDGERLKDDVERPKEEERPKEYERVREEQEPSDDQISHSDLVEPRGEKGRRTALPSEDQGSAVPTKSDEPTDQPPLEELGGSEGDLESSYVLKFSDSEEEEEEAAATDDAGKAGSDSESTSTELPKSLSRADTLLCSDNPYFFSPVGNSSVNQTKSGGDPSGYFPSDLANIPPLQLTTREREIVDKMLEGERSFSLKGFDLTSKETLNKSYVPVLEFSEDESSSGSEKSVPEEALRREGAPEDVVEEEVPEGDEGKGTKGEATEERLQVGAPSEECEGPPVENTATEDALEEPHEERHAPEGVTTEGESDGYDSDRTIEFDRSHITPADSQPCPDQEEPSVAPSGRRNSAEGDAAVSAEHSSPLDGEELEPVGTPVEVVSSTKETNVPETEAKAAEDAQMEEGGGDPETRTSSPVEVAPDNNNIRKEEFQVVREEREPPARTPSRQGLRARTPPREGPKVETPSRRGKRLRTPAGRGKGGRRSSSPPTPSVEAPQKLVTPSPELEARLSTPPREEEPATPSRRGKRVPVTPSAAEGAAAPSTPSRRSRVTSGLDPNAIILEDSTTPLRRSSRRNSYSSSPSRILSTPSRRRRRASESSDPGTAATSEEGDQKRLETGTAVPLLEVGAPVEVLGGQELVEKQEEEAKAAAAGATEEGKPDPPPPDPVEEPGQVVTPSRSRRTPRKSSSGGSTPTLRQDTPRRRSRRLSGAAEGLATIAESEDAVESSAVAPTSSVPSSGVPKNTPGRKPKRKSISQPVEPSLETIQEDAELSNAPQGGPPSVQPPSGEISEEPPVVEGSLVTAEEPVAPRSATPEKRPRRRSVSANQTPSDRTPSRKHPGGAASPRDLMADTLPVARRTRRASLSSNVSEMSPDGVSTKSLTVSASAKNGDAVVASPNPEVSYATFQDEGADVTGRRRLSQLTLNSVYPVDSKRSTLDRRRSSVKSLSTLPYREFNLGDDDSTPVGGFSRRRGSRALDQSSILVIERSPNNNNADGDVLRRRVLEKEDDVFEEEALGSPSPASGGMGQEGAPQGQDPSPYPVYDLLEGAEEVTSLKLPRKVVRPRMRSYRRGVSSMKVQREFLEAEVGENVVAENHPKKKKRKPSGGGPRKGSVQDETVLVLSAREAKGFAFQDPEEVLTNAEVISEVFKELTHQHERMVSETFVFSPPLTLNENKRKRRNKSRKSAK